MKTFIDRLRQWLHRQEQLPEQQSTPPPMAPADWDASPVVDLLIRLRGESTLRQHLGLKECKDLLSVMETGLGIDDRPALEALLTRFLIKNKSDHVLIGQVLDAFYAARADELRLKAEAAQRVASQRADSHRAAEELEKVEKKQSETPDIKKEPERTTETHPSAIARTVETSVELELVFSGDEFVEFGEPGKTPADPVAPMPQGHRFILSEDYQPITVRQMDQMWRFLRKPSRTGRLAADIDLPRTVERFARQGWLNQPVPQREKLNKVHLVLLLDHGGSMLAWHALARQLAASARTGGGHRHAEVYWFTNLPQHMEPDGRAGIVFHDPAHLRPEKMEKLLQRCSKQDTEVLIFSDAGAARGRVNKERINRSILWVRQLQKNVSTVAWLNPMPAHRWWGSSAERIANGMIVPETARTSVAATKNRKYPVAMFESTPRGLMNAINHLRGRWDTLQRLKTEK